MGPIQEKLEQAYEEGPLRHAKTTFLNAINKTASKIKKRLDQKSKREAVVRRSSRSDLPRNKKVTTSKTEILHIPQYDTSFDNARILSSSNNFTRRVTGNKVIYRSKFRLPDQVITHDDFGRRIIQERPKIKSYDYSSKYFGRDKKTNIRRYDTGRIWDPSRKIESLVNKNTVKHTIGKDIITLSKDIDTFFKNTPWASKLVKVGTGVVIANFALRAVSSMVGSVQRQVIPDQYEHGYDVMTENLTDFGSPLKLAKAAQKIITPYYSSLRQNVVTTVSAKERYNLALTLHKNAIQHTRY